MQRGSRGLHLDYAALHGRYVAGESGMTIATEVGINHSGLYRAWKRRGMALRTMSQAKLLVHEQRPDLRRSIKVAQAARRGGTDSMATRVRRAQTREAKLIGVSDNERRLAERLREADCNFRQQAAIGPYNVDFLIGDLALDIDGGGHNPRVRANRPARQTFCEAQGYRVAAVDARRPDWISRALAIVHANTGAQSSEPFG